VWRRKRRKNSSTGRVIRNCWLAWAESRQRKVVAIQRDEAMVGDGDAMGVGAQAVEDILGAAERWFAVDHPLAAEQRAQESG
jgi:hypothetical protein